MPHHFTTSCPVCNHRKFKAFLTCTDFYATSETFDIKRCVNCDFLFTQNFPSESIIGKYYEVQDYISHSDTKKGIVNYLYHLARRYMLKRKANFVEKVCGSKEGSLLDFGCGTGYFLYTMHKRGWKSIGVEKSSKGREFAIREFGLQVNDTSFLSSIADESCEVVTLWHVLEHIEDLEGLLTQLKRVLKPNGTLILALPNSASYDANHYREYWAAYDVPRHLWHFTTKTISLLCEKNKLEVVCQKGMPLDAFYISILSEKNKDSKFAFLRGIYIGFLAYFASRKDISKQSSVIYVLKK